MLSDVREAIVASAVNQRGYVSVQTHLRQIDQAVQVTFRASPATSLLFAPSLTEEDVHPLIQQIVSELHREYGLVPLASDDTTIKFGLPKWYPECRSASPNVEETHTPA